MTERFHLIDEEGDMVLDAVMPGWFDRAACASNGQLLDDFFVEESHKNATEKTLAAKRICAGCPVRRECLTWAFETVDRCHIALKWIYSDDEEPEPVWVFTDMEAELRDGVFGGLSPSERVFAAQADDPVAFGIGVLDKQVSIGQVTSPVTQRWEVQVAVTVVGPE